MTKPPQPSNSGPGARIAFNHYLRTGRRIARAPEHGPERKFNPYHDPRNGRFTFAPGGSRSIPDPIISDPHGLLKPQSSLTDPGRRTAFEQPATSKIGGLPGLQGPASALQADLHRRGRNGRTPPSDREPGGRHPSGDAVLLDHAFPGLSRSPAGAIVQLADAIFDLTGAAQEVTRKLHRARIRQLVTDIREIDPHFHFESLREPDTIQGRVNEIKALRFRRALAYYRQRNDLRPLQLEVLRIMQDRADSAYEEAVKRYQSGRLMPRLSREEAIGNYVDSDVRAALRRIFNGYQVDISRGQQIRVVGREYETSASDRTYRIPDARVGPIAFDVTLTRKSLGTAQVRGFFASDFKPDAVIIVRPSQLGGTYTYAIKRPGRAK